MKKNSISIVKEFLEQNDINHECELISTEYIDCDSPLVFKCSECGENFERSFRNLKRNEHYKCKTCARGRKLTLQQVKEYLEKYDVKHECELLSKYYKNCNEHLKFKCNICGSIFYRNFTQVKILKEKESGFACELCLRHRHIPSNIFSIEYVKDFIQQYDVDHCCELLSTEYIDQNSPLIFKCNLCGVIFTRNFATMKAKKAFKCTKCARNLPKERIGDIYLSNVRFFRGKLYKWKKEQLNENSKCDITGLKTDLEIHHLTSFSTILRLAEKNSGISLKQHYINELKNEGYDIERLLNEFLTLHEKYGQSVILTKNIHQEFHKTYGYKNNTPEQYYQFKQIKMEVQNGTTKND